MNFRKSIQEITLNNNLPIKTKIMLVKGIKQTIKNQIERTKKNMIKSSHSYRVMTQDFDVMFKEIQNKILKTQKQLFSQHRNCIEQLNCPIKSLQDQVESVSKLKDINMQLQNLISQIKEKKPCIQDLSKSISDHLCVKKLKLEVQFETRMMQYSKNNTKKQKQNKKNQSNIVLPTYKYK